MRRARDSAHDNSVEEHAELALLLGHLADPIRKPEAAERMVRCARRNRVRRAARLDHRVEGALPAVANPDVETRLLHADIASHNPGQLDVADDLEARVVAVDPELLHGRYA